MSNQGHNHHSELRNIINMVWRRKWIILIPFIVISSAVTLYGLYLPNLYRSTTSIFIEPQKVPTDYVRSTVTTDIESRLRTIYQQLTSRTKLLMVTNELNLYPEARENLVPDEILVSNMRKNLEVETPNRREAIFFMVHFVHEDPIKAQQGVSLLVSLFIEESLQIREKQAVGTTKFIEEELESLKEILEKQEAEIQSFKKQYMGELPDQLDANLRMLDNLFLQLSENTESQREVENRIILFEQEITRLEGQIQIQTVTMDNDGTFVSATLSQLIAQRNLILEEIGQLEATYTQRHPDFISARKKLAGIEKKISNVQSNLNSQDKPPVVSAPTTISLDFSRELSNMRRQLNENKPKITTLLHEEEDLRSRIKLYQTRVETAPKREQQLLSLTRDYENIQSNYDDLLNKKQEAKLSEHLEKRQKGEKFRILDPANLPEKPYLPNRLKIIIIGLVGGLGIGVGLALLQESLYPAFHDLSMLKESFDIPIIISIPEIVPPGEKKKKWIRFFFRVGAGVGLIVIFLFLVDRYIFDLAEITKRIGGNLRSVRL